MADIFVNTPKRERDVHYYRKRYKNRVFENLLSFFAEEAERTGVTKRDIADRLRRDPAQITRWFQGPSNLTLDTISDLLLALDSEAEPPEIIRFSERAIPNYMHPLMARIVGGVHRPERPPNAIVFETDAEDAAVVAETANATPQSTVSVSLELQAA